PITPPAVPFSHTTPPPPTPTLFPYTTLFRSSDVANAIFDATDAVMLSGETSVGKFPVGAVHVMSRVAEVTEQYLIGQGERHELPDRKSTRLNSSHVSISYAVFCLKKKKKQRT